MIDTGGHCALLNLYVTVYLSLVYYEILLTSDFIW